MYWDDVSSKNGGSMVISWDLDGLNGVFDGILMGLNGF